jgi:hypothetical protein
MEKIENIYAFCDRWCERCAFGSRCEAFAAPKKIRKPENMLADDEMNRTFWENLEIRLDEVTRKIEEKAADRDVDLSVFEGVSTKAKFDLFQRKAINNMVLKAGRLYEDKVDDFLDERAEAGQIAMEALQQGSVFKITSESLSDTDKQDANDGIAIVMRYQLQLYLKLSRAYYSRGREQEERTEKSEVIESDGTVKVALMLINRSLVAWDDLQRYFPEQTSEIDEILFLLARMKSHLEEEFPQALGFIRPGFDE